MLLTSWRKSIKSVAHEIDTFDDRIPTQQLLDICHSVDPSPLCMCFFLLRRIHDVILMTLSVLTGGRLFEKWLTTLASHQSHKMWKKIQRAVIDNPDTVVSLERQNAIMDREQTNFHGFVLLACNSIGRKGKRQLFYATFIARYHGLSRMGAEILAKYGYTMSRTMYYDMRKDLIEQSRATTRLHERKRETIYRSVNRMCVQIC